MPVKNKNKIFNLQLQLLKDRKYKNLFDLSKNVTGKRYTLYYYNAGTTVSIDDLGKIAKFFKIKYEDVVWEYRRNFNARLERPGRGEK